MLTATTDLDRVTTSWQVASERLRTLRVATDAAREELGPCYADEAFWANVESQASQEVSPWYSDTLRRLQSELFISALRVQETFLHTANAKSGCITTSLAAFFAYLRGDIQATPKEAGAMWSTFFLIVPVVSSTFASMQTMFRDLGPDSLPWLLIDEAGQAVPQAAVGAIWRARRVGVVGDPLQIEPVVTAPAAVMRNLREYAGLKESQLGAATSVQTVADRANPIGAYLRVEGLRHWVGVPLRVHRRCLNPMFDIANRIAYDGKMFCSTAPPKTITLTMPNLFLQCEGEVDGRHFVPAQAEAVERLLRVEIEQQQRLPDVFIISPFSEVAVRLRHWLADPLRVALSEIRPTGPGEVRRWLVDRVGTVHTFQGKQAQGVILCLGLDRQHRGGASWAAAKPNLLNVALTRAKHRFVAVGDRRVWLGQPYFSELDQLNV